VRRGGAWAPGSSRSRTPPPRWGCPAEWPWRRGPALHPHLRLHLLLRRLREGHQPHRRRHDRAALTQQGRQRATDAPMACNNTKTPSIFKEKSLLNAVISAKNHKRQRRKRQSVTANREKSQTPKFLTAILTLLNLT